MHKDLEKEIARFFGTEDAILYTSCFDANTGLFETILQEGDAVFSDELNHASIIDGVRLCKAERFRFKHSDMADLQSQIKEFGERKIGDAIFKPDKMTPAHRPPRMLIVTDGVFSMDGDTAKLSQICDLAERYGTMVMVDDSHGSGVLGSKGRGSVEGLMDRVDILTSTFGKALGGANGADGTAESRAGFLAAPYERRFQGLPELSDRPRRARPRGRPGTRPLGASSERTGRRRALGGAR